MTLIGTRLHSPLVPNSSIAIKTTGKPSASTVHPITKEIIHLPLGRNYTQSTTMIPPITEPIDQETYPEIRNEEQQHLVINLRRQPNFLFHDPTSDDEDEALPFQIHRKLLRRRHVRKEQMQRRRQLEQARFAEKTKRDSRKRGQKEEAFEDDAQSTVTVTESPKHDISTPKGPTSSGVQYSFHPTGVPLSLVTSSCSGNSTFIEIPKISPLRPIKRRKTFA